MTKQIITFTLLSFIGFASLFARGNWELLIPSPTSNQMAGLYFIDDHTGWSVGKYGTILKTTDGGETWSIKEISWLNDLSDIHFPTAQTGYAIGTDGFIIKSTDGGETWTQQENFYSNNLNRVLFKDEMNGWIIGEKGMILHTVDGGTNWLLQTSNSREDLLGIDFIGTDTLCVVGENETILLTGITDDAWSIIEFTLNDPYFTFSCEDVYFADEMHGWICGYDNQEGGIILASTNGGLQWEKTRIGGSKTISWSGHGTSSHFYEQLQQIYFYDDLKTGFVLTKSSEYSSNGNILMKTTSGGRSWTGISEGSGNGFNAPGRFCVLSENRIVITGNRGDFRYSDDKGKIVRFLNHHLRWWDVLIIGDDGQLIAFQSHFKRDLALVASLPDPSKMNSSSVFNLYRSNDYGTTWQKFTPRFYNLAGSELTTDNFLSFGSSYFVNRDTLWTIHMDTLRSESIFYSTDFGLTYREARPGLNSDQFIGEMYFLTPDTLINYFLLEVEISPGNYKSTLLFDYSLDGGESFEHIENSDIWNDITPAGIYNFKAVNGHYFFDGRTGFLVGSEGNIIKTTDTGKTWTNIYSGVVEDLYDIEFLDYTTGFVVGDFGRILKTGDGGATWRKTNSGTQENIYSIGFLNDREGWVGTENGLRYTVDAGETWQGVPLRYNHVQVRQLYFDNNNNGYAYTLPRYSNVDDSYVCLFRMKNSSIDIADDYISQYPTTIALSQNYPNPFNAMTHIEYHLPKSGDVLLKIYNLQGQLVCTLVNQTHKTGNHSATWDSRSDSGTMVSSGIYIYQLRCNDEVKYRKLLLLK